MKKQIRVAAISTLLLSSIAAPSVSFAKETIVANVQANTNFTDVDKNHYAYEAIKWAQQQGIVSGYTDNKGKPNGKFGPNDSVTEAQFTKMLVEFYGFKDDKGDLNIHTPAPLWSDTYYDALAAYGVPLNGYFDSGLRNKPVKRGVVAQAIGHISGNVNSLADSINYMIGEGITTGQNPQYENSDLFKYFGTNNTLTRSQAVAFLYRMHNIGVNKAGGIAVSVYNNTESLTLAALANKGVSKLDSSLKLGSLGSDKPVSNNNSGTIPSGETNSDYSNSKIPVASDAPANRINVNDINKVVSKISEASYKKILEAGYEVSFTDTNTIYLGDLDIHVRDSNEEIGYISYNKSVSTDLLISLAKELFGLKLTTNDLYPSFENKTSEYIIENFGNDFIMRVQNFKN
ncbi:S-layer homology domain-containing protein [Lysinibacillus sp. ACHW1.5]|uniref:S-layer homology domain-containing protein n=1 Tax=Lysinibacillus sp. ACHW1.5 TaxID=2913506 RepID=UPI001EDC6ABA|nr:S-layer homology domain-containing protein [Lysinibacillus sp. ACHW1.5]UKJ43432.1 S-layer homology domain-containing protein [Lysinibacillus sp. ACHW1.5]